MSIVLEGLDLRAEGNPEHKQEENGSVTTVICSYLSQQDISIPLPPRDRQLQGWRFTTAFPSHFLPWHERLSCEVSARLSKSVEFLMIADDGGCLTRAEVPESDGFVSHHNIKTFASSPLLETLGSFAKVEHCSVAFTNVPFQCLVQNRHSINTSWVKILSLLHNTPSAPFSVQNSSAHSSVSSACFVPKQPFPSVVGNWNYKGISVLYIRVATWLVYRTAVPSNGNIRILIQCICYANYFTTVT